LIPGVIHCQSLRRLEFEGIDAVTSKGWQAFAEMFKDPNYNCRELSLSGINFDDAAGIAFADALVHNHTLKRLSMGNDYGFSITGETRKAFSTLHQASMQHLNRTTHFALVTTLEH